jgi:phosphoglycerate dehydrogenase-like enzyme
MRDASIIANYAAICAAGPGAATQIAYNGSPNNNSCIRSALLVTTLVVSSRFRKAHGQDIAAAAQAAGITLDWLTLPDDPEARLDAATCARADIAFYTHDAFIERPRQFFSALGHAPRLKWLHVFNAGVDHPVFAGVLERGIRLTTSAGSTATPIAHTAIAGLLMLARGFPHWLDAQRRCAWEPLRGNAMPRDLDGQTLLILGLGHIGREIARLARALGLKVIGVRRSPRLPADPVDELHPPAALPALLPRIDWLVVACPLTADTRHLVNAERLAQLPQHACVINVSRGAIIDEPALIAALAGRKLAGAYLDVFETEPLPPDSPLWRLPNVIVTPHDSVASAGNDQRINRIFIDNLKRWVQGEPLVNEVFEIRKPKSEGE